MARRIEGRNLEAELEAVERRLDRLERLTYLAFQDTRDLAEYTYESVLTEPEDLKRLSWTKPTFHHLSDQEAMTVAGLGVHELVALKMTTRVLRKQARHDILGIVRDLVRRGARERVKGIA